MSSRFGVLVILAGVLVAFPLSVLDAQETGRITGTVAAAETGEPLAFANVILVGTQHGTFVTRNGTFILDNVPAGTYSVRVKMMGYAAETRENVVVRPGATVTLEFRLQEEVVLEIEPVVVVGSRLSDDVEKTQTVRPIDLEEIDVRSINTLEEAIASVPGVIIQEGEIHVRGGRAWEVKPYSDGLPVSDDFVGVTDLNISLVSLADIEILTGGFDAEYGNVQSAVINLKTKEGGSRYGGTLKFMTDDYGAPDKTYFNYDDLAIGYGGPLINQNLRFFVSGRPRSAIPILRPRNPGSRKSSGASSSSRTGRPTPTPDRPKSLIPFHPP